VNIFVLHENPEIAASYHCDQHLHKMILESAQMLSTWAWSNFPKARPHIYKPAYENHPCTQWVSKATDNRIYLIQLARGLENVRQSLGHEEHSSSKIIEVIADIVGHDDFPQMYETPTEFVFAGIPSIAIRNESVVQKYQRYYRFKHKQWLDTRAPMSYKGRPAPSFMADLFQ